MTTDVTSTNSVLNNYLQQQSKNIAADKTAAAAGTTSTVSSSASSTSSSSSSAGIFKNESTFLNILTTQLKNQDPTSSTDTNQFTQELVQFAQVEQQLNTNTKLDNLVALQKSGTAMAIGYIGQTVEASTTTGQMALQNGKAQVGYTLPATTKSATITVKDSSGATVATLTGGTTAGLNYVTWNGQSSSGTQETDGAYTFSVAAVSTTGSTENITDTRVVGKVTGVTSNSDGSTNLQLGAVSILTTAVDAVFTPTSSSSTSNTSS